MLFWSCSQGCSQGCSRRPQADPSAAAPAVHFLLRAAQGLQGVQDARQAFFPRAFAFEGGFDAVQA